MSEARRKAAETKSQKEGKINRNRKKKLIEERRQENKKCYKQFDARK